MRTWSQDAWEAVKGDGCTSIPDLWMETPCQRHDRHYEFHTHQDGTPITRLEADWELLKDSWKALPVIPKGPWTLRNFLPRLALAPVRLVAKVVVPPLVFGGVRVGGGPHWD